MIHLYALAPLAAGVTISAHVAHTVSDGYRPPIDLLDGFHLVSSDLTAHGRHHADTNVPEPGALGLLGVGLLAVALGARRKQANT